MFLRVFLSLVALSGVARANTLTFDEHVTLIRELPFVPGPAKIVADFLYLSAKSEVPGCEGAGVFQVDAAQGMLKEIAKTPCVRSLLDVEGMLVVEYFESSTVQWRAFRNSEWQKLEDALPDPVTHLPYVREKLFTLGQKLAPDSQGYLAMRSSPVALRYLPEEKTWSYLMSPPESLRLPPFLVASGQLLGAKTELKVGSLPLGEGETIEKFSPAPENRFYAVIRNTSQSRNAVLVAGVTGENSLKNRFSEGSTSKDKSTQKLEDISQLISLQDGDAVLRDPGETTQTPAKFWRFEKGAAQLSELNIPARDVTAITPTNDGILVSRRTQIDYYGGKVGINNRALWEKNAQRGWGKKKAECPSVSLFTRLNGSEAILARMQDKTGEVEMVPVLENVKKTQMQCGANSLAMLTQSFTPVVVAGSLKPELTPVSKERGTGTDVPTALRLMTPWTKGENLEVKLPENKSFLTLLIGNRLVLARAPFRQTQFSSLENIPGQADNYLAFLTYTETGELYPSALWLKADGTSQLVKAPVPRQGAAK